MAWYCVLLMGVGTLALWFLLSSLFYKQFFKRFHDIVLSFIALVVLSPLLLILTILGAIQMKGNPFFTQKRPGKKRKNGQEKIFSLIKFRSMTEAKDKDGKYLPDEVRLTYYGKVLRSTSLDELPELFNILKGDMSIIGPRPQLVRDMVFMTEEQRHRHDVRPGLSGLAQINGRNAINWFDRFKYDLEYVKSITFWGDVKIVFITIGKIFVREGIREEGMATSMDYGDFLLYVGKITRDEYTYKQNEAIKYELR